MNPGWVRAKILLSLFAASLAGLVLVRVLLASAELEAG
jgi:hypothetical protein